MKMKKGFKVMAATVMAAVVLLTGSMDVCAAPFVIKSVTPQTDAKGYIFERYEENRINGVSVPKLVKMTSYNSKGAKGITEEYRYDSQGRLSEMYMTFGNYPQPDYISLYTYDEQGNFIKETEFFNPQKTVSAEYTYDGKGNMTKWVDYFQDGTVAHYSEYAFTYDKQGKPLKYTTQPSYTVNYIYDSLGRISGKTGYTGKRQDLNISFKYDAAGRLIEVVEAQVAEAVLNFPEMEYTTRKTYVYDAAGRLAKVNDADCIYDEAGNLVKEANPNGSRTEYFYE